MPNNAKKNVYKQKEFQIYLLWKSLPAHVHGMKRAELESSGFTDPLILKILKIKNQTEFAKKFNIKDLGTLTDWNNKIKKENIASPILVNNFEEQLSNINKQIILPQIDELKQIIIEQNKTIFLLKNENLSLKSKLKPRVKIRKEKEIISSVSIDETRIDSLSKKNNPKEIIKGSSIFQQIKNLFLG